MMDRPDLAEELVRMAAEDDALRTRLANSGELFEGYNREMRAVHRRNGDRFERILDELGCWPGQCLVGLKGSDAAFLIAQHDIANPALMRRCRDLYRVAVERADATPAKLAAIEDRIRYFEGRLQTYGTHWGWDETGTFGPWPPVEDPTTVDEQRKGLGLPPLAESLRVAQVDRPLHRNPKKVRAEHRQGDEFAYLVGWRDRPTTTCHRTATQ